jgi:hypothetical protein
MNSSSDFTISLTDQSNLPPPHRSSMHSYPHAIESSDKLAPYNQQQRPYGLIGLRSFSAKTALSLLDRFGYYTRIKTDRIRSVSVLLHIKNDKLLK